MKHRFSQVRVVPEAVWMLGWGRYREPEWNLLRQSFGKFLRDSLSVESLDGIELHERMDADEKTGRIWLIIECEVETPDPEE